MKKQLAGLIVSVLIFAGCQGAVTPNSNPGSAVTQPVSGTSISMTGNTFSPANLLVKAGQKVTWANNDAYAHTVTADDGSFSSGSIAASQNFSFTFDKKGTFTYHCTIHPSMTGTVTVQ